MQHDTVPENDLFIKQSERELPTTCGIFLLRIIIEFEKDIYLTPPSFQFLLCRTKYHFFFIFVHFKLVEYLLRGFSKKILVIEMETIFLLSMAIPKM